MVAAKQLPIYVLVLGKGGGALTSCWPPIARSSQAATGLDNSLSFATETIIMVKLG